MKRQPNRLAADALHGFGGNEIDRSKPLSFSLNGRRYDAYAGDTVLSALLAAGMDAAGRHGSDPIALESSCAPLIAPSSKANDPAAAMPMDVVPARAGAQFVTVGPRLDLLPQRGIAGRLAALVRDQRSLGHKLDDARSLDDLADSDAAETISCDTLVIGGGIAGMTAALAGADAGGRVVLIERRPTLGGDARFFGTVGDEASPESTIEKLAAQIAETPGITCLTRTQALSLTGTRVKAHQVVVTETEIAARTLVVNAAHVVLATGAVERLPVFPGNRMPGVVGSVEAFHRAERYGVWSGKRALFATPNNYGYRLALLAADAGIDVSRVVDSRIAPQSRFIDFCKASGITLASGLVPQSVETIRKSNEMRVAFAVAVENAGQDAGTVTSELLVVAGGWQPRLNLWLMAGGTCRYDYDRRWLAAAGELDGVSLAGAVAGWRSSTACIASATAVVQKLRGRKVKPVEEYEIDAVYESAEAPAPVAPWRAGRGAYLDQGLSFTMRPAPARDGGHAVQPGTIGLLSLGDVASFVQLGAIPDRDAGVIAQERCIAPEEITDSGWTPASPSREQQLDAIPAYLVGRYGPRPQMVVIKAADGRRLETGCHLYPGSETADPGDVIGSVIGTAPPGKAGALAMVSRSGLAAAPALFVRDTSGPVAVSVSETL